MVFYPCWLLINPVWWRRSSCARYRWGKRGSRDQSSSGDGEWNAPTLPKSWHAQRTRVARTQTDVVVYTGSTSRELKLTSASPSSIRLPVPSPCRWSCYTTRIPPTSFRVGPCSVSFVFVDDWVVFTFFLTYSEPPSSPSQSISAAETPEQSNYNGYVTL